MRNQNVTTAERREQMRAYNQANMSKILKYQSEYKGYKLKTDPLHKLEGAIRRAINQAFRNNGWGKRSKLNAIVGLSYQQYRLYIESTWSEGMNWSNYGKKKDEWNIDHIIAPGKFQTEQEIIEKFHYTNTRAMWATENVRKSNFLN
jgi:hypothetical protein